MLESEWRGCHMPPVPRITEVTSISANGPVVLDASLVELDATDSASSHAISTGKRRYHFPTAEKYDLQIGQVRALDLLLNAVRKGVLMSRQRIKNELGISPLSGTLQTWFDGIGEGTKRGRARKGLISHGLVAQKSLDVDGVNELVLALTPLGIAVATDLETERGDVPLPPLRGKDRSTNKRYMID